MTGTQLCSLYFLQILMEKIKKKYHRFFVVGFLVLLDAMRGEHHILLDVDVREAFEGSKRAPT